MSMHPVEKAIQIAGGQTALAKKLGVSQQTIQKWVARKVIPPRRVLAVEQAINGAVSRHDLAPDLYPREERQLYTGPDRRSGKDRRSDQDRRNGCERRQGRGRRASDRLASAI